VVKSILKIDEPIKFGQFFWDESKGEPGPLVVTVDLAARTLSVFRNGHEIGATAILKGYGDKPTPVGVFPITEKDADHVSNIYDAPMPYMLRLTNDGVDPRQQGGKGLCHQRLHRRARCLCQAPVRTGKAGRQGHHHRRQAHRRGRSHRGGAAGPDAIGRLSLAA
jgi:hypothetical protein